MAFTRVFGGKSANKCGKVVEHPGPVLTDSVEVLGRRRAKSQYGDENRWQDEFSKNAFGAARIMRRNCARR